MRLLPYPNQPKLENLDYGKTVVKIFLYTNKYRWVEPILIKRYENITGNPSPNVFRGQFFGRSTNNVRIQLNIAKCKNPVSVPGFQWSYTGYKADITPAGVLAHEVGHYVDFLSGWRYGKEFSTCPGNAVSSYEPNFHEKFAESMRLFILNPELLKEASPWRYKMIKEIGLKPVLNKPWREVLKHAHPKIISAAESWIKAK